MAAYAAVTSLMYILEQIHHHPCPPISIEVQHMRSLSENVSVFQDFLENYSHRDKGAHCNEAFETQIADAAYAAEDVIESHIVDQILAEKKGSDYNIFCQDLQKVIEDMDFIKKEVMKIQEKIRGMKEDHLPRSIISVYVDSPTAPPTRKNVMVGFDDLIIEIMDRLTGNQPNLQFLPIVGMGGTGTWGNKAVAPPEIWKMLHLRHLEFDWFILPDPPNVPIHESDHDFILINLQTLIGIRDFKLTEAVIERIPNIKKLRLHYVSFPDGWSHNYCLDNLGRLNQLESLACIFLSPDKSNKRVELLQNFALPHSLKKLTLRATNLLWDDMRMIGSLPHLQVLKLENESFSGPNWDPVEGEFLRLKFLLVEWCCDLVCWTADKTHFPCLEHLVLEELNNLKEIPLDIGEIPTLRSIELIHCSQSTVISAKNILEEQETLGNVGLQVDVRCLRKTRVLEGLESKNFQVQTTQY